MVNFRYMIRRLIPLNKCDILIILFCFLTFLTTVFVSKKHMFLCLKKYYVLKIRKKT